MRNTEAKHAERLRCASLIWPAMLGFALLVGLCTVTPIDLALSAYFYDPGDPQGWFLREAAPWIWLYRYGEYPGILMALSAALFWAGSWVRRAWTVYRRRCLVLVLAVALGPGVLVNGILKPFWGRPRPRQTVQFGGSQPYRPWWQPGGFGTGRSFPSGHASMGYILISGACLISHRRLRSLAFAGGLGYGTLLGITRIVQGGHFVSDVVWSGTLMCGVVVGLQAALLRPPVALEADVGSVDV